ncbi:hypothetical protein [uncultured Acetatifactor sp.]|uniref:hypothetical protein n=1 Tax=uncultured Acetatifactor sp. TaxID=1671927 RepID=UPI00261D5EDB|nr:hypothetical protein [uncultured Acetatifactor sp.]
MRRSDSKYKRTVWQYSAWGLEAVRGLLVDFSEEPFQGLVDYATVYWDWTGVHLPRRSGNQHGDLKPEAAGASVLCQMPPAAFSVNIDCLPPE